MRTKTIGSTMRKAAVAFAAALIAVTLAVPGLAFAEEAVSGSISKSKNAVPTDQGATVTLGLPAENIPVADIVFVLDSSSCNSNVAAQAADMVEELSENIGSAKLNVGVVKFKSGAESYFFNDVAQEGTIEEIQTYINTKPSGPGSNMHAGLLEAQNLLQASSTDAAHQYVILISDGITYTWQEEGTQVAINYENKDGGVRYASNSEWEVRHGSLGWAPDDWASHLTEQYALFNPEKVSVYSRDAADVAANPYVAYSEVNTCTGTVDAALYNCWQTFAGMSDTYNMYAIVSPNKQYGASFMSFLANGQTFTFDDIEYDIYYLVSAGTKVVDVIGKGADNLGDKYDFNFVNSADSLVLTVDGEALPVTQLSENEYGFGTMEDGVYPFTLTYEPDAADGEQFTWNINTDISAFHPVTLTYDVTLDSDFTLEGTHELETNASATLYPVDSDGTEGEPELFPVPVIAKEFTPDSPVPGPEPDPDDPDDPEDPEDPDNPDDPEDPKDPVNPSNNGNGGTPMATTGDAGVFPIVVLGIGALASAVAFFVARRMKRSKR